MWGSPFWLGGEFIISGIMTFPENNYPSHFLFTPAVILTKSDSAILAMIAVGLYSWDLVSTSSYSAFNYSAGLTPEQRMYTDSSLYFEDFNVMIRGTMDVVIIVFTVFQLCINVTYVVLSLRACFRKESLDDPQLHKLLPEEITANPAC